MPCTKLAWPRPPKKWRRKNCWIAWIMPAWNGIWYIYVPSDFLTLLFCVCAAHGAQCRDRWFIVDIFFDVAFYFVVSNRFWLLLNDVDNHKFFVGKASEMVFNPVRSWWGIFHVRKIGWKMDAIEVMEVLPHAKWTTLTHQAKLSILIKVDEKQYNRHPTRPHFPHKCQNFINRIMQYGMRLCVYISLLTWQPDQAKLFYTSPWIFIHHHQILNSVVTFSCSAISPWISAKPSINIPEKKKNM